MNGGRFDFDDGGTYCGGWEEGKAHGHGVCTGPQGKGEYAGAWHYGFEVSGVYTWPSGNTYQGQWQNGKRHGLGVEQRGRWVYKGEWTQGYKGRYGHRLSMTSQARYQGTWSAGFHDGYGTETYVDGGAYQGQWLRGMRHGYGIRKSAQHGVAAKFRSRSRTNASLTSLRSEYGENEENERNYDEINESRGGFVLKACSRAPTRRRSLSERSLAVKRTILGGLRIKKQHSTGDIHQHVTTGNNIEWQFEEDHIEPNTTEVYKGEWKNDKRCGFGVGERSDGLKYEGEWFNNRKCGYGITTFRDGRREEGKYKNNVLVCSNRKKGLLFVHSSRLKERVGDAVEAANRAANIAQQKADIAVSRTTTAKERSEQADYIALQAREDADTARICAKQFAPLFRQHDTEATRAQINCLQQQHSAGTISSTNHVSFDSPPPSKNSHESRDLCDEVVIVNSSSGKAASEVACTPSQQQTPGRAPYQPQVTVNLGSYQQGVMTTCDVDYMSSPLQQQLQSSNRGGYQSSSGIKASNITPMYYHHYHHQQQQQQHNVSSVGYANPQQNPTFSPTSYQVLPSVSSSHKKVEDYQPIIQTPLISDTPQTVVQIPHTSSSSSYRPNALPHHNYNALHQYQQKQQQPYQNVRASHPGTEFAIPEQQPFIPHSDNTTFDINGDLHQRQFSNGTPCSIENISPVSSRSLLQNTNVAQSNSRMSLSDDHYDQYIMFPNTSKSGLVHRNRPSLTRQPFAVHDITQNLYRRSTLATPGDKRLEDAMRRGRESSGDDDEFEEVEGRSSLPNLVELEVSGVHLGREEAARLASQQRQELQRLLEEEQLLRNNPLRYLFHPAFRAWIIRWKMPLVLSVANIFLLMVFYNLLTYEKRMRERR